jgi:anti-sigma B factor antagonist
VKAVRSSQALGLDLDITVSRAGSRVVAAVSGDLDVYSAPALSHLLDDLIVGQGNLFVDVDLSRVGVLDAAALRVLVVRRMTLAAHGGVLALAGLGPNLYRVLAITGHSQTFTIRSYASARSGSQPRQRPPSLDTRLDGTRPVVDD